LIDKYNSKRKNVKTLDEMIENWGPWAK